MDVPFLTLCGTVNVKIGVSTHFSVNSPYRLLQPFKRTRPLRFTLQAPKINPRIPSALIKREVEVTSVAGRTPGFRGAQDWASPQFHLSFVLPTG